MSVFSHSTMSAANPIWNMLTIGELWKPIYLMSQPPNKLYMCTYTFVCTAPRSRRHGQWGFRMARHITASTSLCSTFYPPQMRIKLNTEWLDRHPRVIKAPQGGHGIFHQGLKCHGNWKSGQAVPTATSHWTETRVALVYHRSHTISLFWKVSCNIVHSLFFFF